MLKAICSCFSKDDINNGRQAEVDITKGFAVIFMVWVHVLMYMGDAQESILTGILYDIWGGPFAAPVFMISMGAGICYSRKQGAMDLAVRGIRLLVGSILLNFLRFTTYMILSNLRGYGYTGQSFFKCLMLVDILSFAGLALLFLAAAKKMRWSNLVMFLISVLCSICGVLLRHRSTGSYVADGFVNFIWAANSSSCFPFLNWIVFPVSGVILGQWLKRLHDKETFYRMVSPVCLFTSVVYIGVAYATSSRLYAPDVEYYLLDFVDAFFCVLLYIGLLGQNYLMLRMMKRRRFSVLRRFSCHLNAIYCIHWVLLMGCYFMNWVYDGPNAYGFAEITLFAAALLVISDAMAYVYLKGIKPMFLRQNNAERSLERMTGHRSIRYALLTLIMH